MGQVVSWGVRHAYIYAWPPDVSDVFTSLAKILVLCLAFCRIETPAPEQQKHQDNHYYPQLKVTFKVAKPR